MKAEQFILLYLAASYVFCVGNSIENNRRNCHYQWMPKYFFRLSTNNLIPKDGAELPDNEAVIVACLHPWRIADFLPNWNLRSE